MQNKGDSGVEHEGQTLGSTVQAEQTRGHQRHKPQAGIEQRTWAWFGAGSAPLSEVSNASEDGMSCRWPSEMATTLVGGLRVKG